MSKKRKYIGDGAYEDMNEPGKFYSRPTVSGKRTWRLLKATTAKYAKEEARAKATDHGRSEVGMAESPYAPKTGQTTFADMAALYLSAQCPNTRGEPRPPEFCDGEKSRMDSLVRFFGRMPVVSIHLADLDDHREWRLKRRKKLFWSSERAVELEWVTLSNVLNYAVRKRLIPYNPVRSGRPRLRKAADVNHSRERSIESGDVLHKLGAYFLSSVKSEAIGWLLFFSAMTGCRNIELRALRRDAKSTDDPGFIEEGDEKDYLYLNRAKHGINPFCEITPEMKAMLECFFNWHDTRFGKRKSPWFFPGREGGQLDEGAFTHALARACKALNLPHCSGHGIRSFYVTKRRSDGASDLQIAAEIGDKTASLIATTYGDIPKKGFGKKHITFLPSTGRPAWEEWSLAVPAGNVVKLPAVAEQDDFDMEVARELAALGVQ